MTASHVTDVLADWSPWLAFDQAVVAAPRLPGVYMAREGTEGEVVCRPVEQSQMRGFSSEPATHGPVTGCRQRSADDGNGCGRSGTHRKT